MARIWNTYLVARLGNMVGYDLRMEFYRQMLRLDMTNFTEAGRGDLMNRCTSDLNAVSQGVQRVFGQALLEPLQMLVCLAIAAYVSWQLLLLTMIDARRWRATRFSGSAKRSSAPIAKPCRSFPSSTKRSPKRSAASS